VDAGSSLDLSQLVAAFAVDLVAIVTFAIGIYFRRHTRKDLAVVFTFFNLCLFVVITVIQTTEVAAALGFGLFAILSIIRLRSEPFDNREIGYFFGALVLGLLNGIGTGSLLVTITLDVVVVGAMFVLDHPRVLRAGERRHITLDLVVTDGPALDRVLAERLGAPVAHVNVIAIDYVRDSMELEVQLVATRTPARAAVRPDGGSPWLGLRRPAEELVR
jgi:hypothetical protein